MVKVPLTQGYVALIDDEDAERVLQFKWRVRLCPNGKRYGRRNLTIGPYKRQDVALHRFILNAPKGVQVDHRDNDGLNCQKHNLRLATSSQNQQNRWKHRNVNGFKGVEFHPNVQRKRYSSRIKLNGRSTFLGYYLSAEEAARAYDAKARELFGEFARTNFEENK